MDNHIRHVEVCDRSLIPAEAEVWIRVTAEQHTPTTELRGRLMGPSCPYASTVEVAYSLRPLPPGCAETPSALVRRVVIPEACLWEPESPFLYHGPIELWQDGQRCDQRTLRHGLRSLQLNERGLRINGRARTLHGRCIDACSDEELVKLRQESCNLLVVAVEEGTLPMWERADRLGFLMLGRIEKVDLTTRHCLQMASEHPSCLGWLMEESTPLPFHALPQTGLAGLLCDAPPSNLSLSLVHFLVGPPALANLGKPLLVTEDRPADPDAASALLGRLV